MPKITIKITPVLSVVLLMVLHGCGTGKKLTTVPAKENKVVCAEAWLPFPYQPHPLFSEIPASATVPEPGISLPKSYIRYHVNGDTLQALFAQVPATEGKIMIVLPVNRQCVSFTLSRSGVLDPSLQQKYPGIISMKGRSADHHSAEARLDWNGRELRGQISFDGDIYYILPYKEGDNVAYLFYNRDDSGEVKQPFEQQPVKFNKHTTQYDR